MRIGTGACNALRNHGYSEHLSCTKDMGREKAIAYNENQLCRMLVVPNYSLLLVPKVV